MFFAKLIAAVLIAVMFKFGVALCGHRVTWRLSAVLSLIAVFH